MLGTSVDAVRKRIAHGTLESEKVDGKVYVWLDDGAPQSNTDALISSKDETIAVLREQLEAERQAHAEARRIIAGLVERIPAIEAPQEASEAAGTVEEEPEMSDFPSNTATTEHVDEAIPEEDMRFVEEDRLRDAEEALRVAENNFRAERTLRLVRAAIWTVVVITFLSFLTTSLSAAGTSFSSTISSVFSAFSTAISSGLSAVSGDQLVTIISAIIGVIGTITATYLTIRANRGARNR